MQQGVERGNLEDKEKPNKGLVTKAAQERTHFVNEFHLHKGCPHNNKIEVCTLLNRKVDGKTKEKRSLETQADKQNQRPCNKV